MGFEQFAVTIMLSIYKGRADASKPSKTLWQKGEFMWIPAVSVRVSRWV